MKLYTLGPGNRKPEDVFALLPPGDVTIFDVRRSPRSTWQPEYDRPQLESRFGRGYVWAPDLGNARGGTADNWRPAWGQQKADERLDSIACFIPIAPGPVVLWCAERRATDCHRRLVAEEIARLLPGLEIIHL